ERLLEGARAADADDSAVEPGLAQGKGEGAADQADSDDSDGANRHPGRATLVGGRLLMLELAHRLHDAIEDARHGLLGQGAVVGALEVLVNAPFALRVEDVDGGLALEGREMLYALGSAVQQRDELAVDLV